jgi:hypothetical protein
MTVSLLLLIGVSGLLFLLAAGVVVLVIVLTRSRSTPRND